MTSRRLLARYAADQLLAGQSAQQLAKQLAAALLENGQASNIDYLIGDIVAELERRQAMTVSKVSSASALSDSLRRQLIDQLKAATKVQRVVLEETVDKSLIGGLRVETAGRVWDTTLRRKLQQLKEIA